MCIKLQVNFHRLRQYPAALYEMLDGQQQLVAKHVQVLVLFFRKGGTRFFPIGIKCPNAGFFIGNR